MSISFNKVEEFRLVDLPLLSMEEKAVLNKCNSYLKNAYMSAFPGDRSEEKALKMHQLLNARRVTTIISLIPPSEMKSKGFKPYEEIAQSVNAHVAFRHLPIQDVSVTNDEAVRKFILQELIPLTEDPNQTVLVHCHGGNGRSSTIAVIHTSLQYQMNFHDALRHVFKCYLTRKDPLRYIPESKAQFEQMKRLCVGEPSKLTFKEWLDEAKEMVAELRPDMLEPFEMDRHWRGLS
jgi:protein-tyrosine phosphatase